MKRLLLFYGSSDCDPAIEPWFRSKPDALSAIARRWFAVMRGRGADVRELFHDGCPVVCVDDAPFAYVNAFTAHVNAGFFQGASLADPAGLLTGDGRYMRHVKLKPGREIDETALLRLIDDAYADIKTRLDADRD